MWWAFRKGIVNGYAVYMDMLYIWIWYVYGYVVYMDMLCIWICYVYGSVMHMDMLWGGKTLKFPKKIKDSGGPGVRATARTCTK